MENYFNYFTEIEECFQRSRQTKTLLSPLDWALIESWKDAGYPLEAVLAGIERAFEKYRARPRKYQRVNSLAYCAQEVARAVEEATAGGARRETKAITESPFAATDITAYLRQSAEALERAANQAQEHGQQVLRDDLSAAAASLREIAARETGKPVPDFEELERHLTALEEKVTAVLTRASDVELLAKFRQEVEKGLVPYRRKMTAPQIESLERQFLKKSLLEHYRVPRLSLFYL